MAAGVGEGEERYECAVLSPVGDGANDRLIERVLWGVELAGDDAGESVVRDKDGVRVLERGRRKAIFL